MMRDSYAQALGLGWMQDRCIILRRVAAERDRYGYRRAAEYAGDVPIPCYYEAATGFRQEAVVQGRLHLPLAAPAPDGALVPVTVGDQDRIRLVQRLGRDLSPPLEFDVLGAATPGPAALTVPLLAVTVGQA